MKSADAVETVGLAELMRSVSCAGRCAAGRLDQRHAVVARIDRADGARAQRLRLQRHHARAEPAEAADAVADMAADVEGEIARPHEARVQRIHRRIARRIAVVDVERAAQRGERRDRRADGIAQIASGGRRSIIRTYGAVFANIRASS